MKVRSKALYDYLLRVNALNGTPEAIARAKQDYRKLYKRQWKQSKRPRKDLRIEVTAKQFAAIQAKAAAANLPVTTYARTVILASVNAFPLLSLDSLCSLLQAVSMAAIATGRDHTLASTHARLLQAEGIILDQIAICHEHR